MKTILIYDGSFEGLLSTVFYIYEYQIDQFSVVKTEEYVANFFDKKEEIISNSNKANRVWKALSTKISANAKRKLYKAFLSELPGIENKICHFIQLAFASKYKIEKDFSNPTILEISKVVKMVDREKHRMDAFVRFRQTKDNIYFATIEPDFNVLPLNSDHFRERYADQKWIIYDVKRKYGLFYNLNTVTTITLEIDEAINNKQNELTFFSDTEVEFQQLWGNYFEHTNIKSRKNTSLHIKHVPKRYWKYLTEKKN
ncbi:MAG: DNA metabolism protein [Aequorivita sp.]|nr:DNA metabolism protein [Aequorivita sp.]